MSAESRKHPRRTFTTIPLRAMVHYSDGQVLIGDLLNLSLNGLGMLLPDTVCRFHRGQTLQVKLSLDPFYPDSWFTCRVVRQRIDVDGAFVGLAIEPLPDAAEEEQRRDRLGRFLAEVYRESWDRAPAAGS